MNVNNRLNLFWNIGKIVFENQNVVDNVTAKYSNYLQYKFGMTECFSRENINLMRKLYLYFPIVNNSFFKLSWEHYLELLKISDLDKRMFYYHISLFFGSSTVDLVLAINNYFYERI